MDFDVIGKTIPLVILFLMWARKKSRNRERQQPETTPPRAHKVPLPGEPEIERDYEPIEPK